MQQSKLPKLGELWRLRDLLFASWWEYLRELSGRLWREALVVTIERVNNELGYEPGNCVWASYAAQARNRRRQSSKL